MADRIVARVHFESAIRQAAQHTQAAAGTHSRPDAPLAALLPVLNEIALGLSHLTDRADARLPFTLAGQNAADRMQGGRLHDRSVIGVLLVLQQIAAGLKDETA